MEYLKCRVQCERVIRESKWNKVKSTAWKSNEGELVVKSEMKTWAQKPTNLNQYTANNFRMRP